MTTPISASRPRLVRRNDHILVGRPSTTLIGFTGASRTAPVSAPCSAQRLGRSSRHPRCGHQRSAPDRQEHARPAHRSGFPGIRAALSRRGSGPGGGPGRPQPVRPAQRPAGHQLWGVTRERKGADHTLAALKSIRAARLSAVRHPGQPVGPLPAASAVTVPPGLGGRNWTAIPTNTKVVALTFDAGANADGVRARVEGQRHDFGVGRDGRPVPAAQARRNRDR